MPRNDKYICNQRAQKYFDTQAHNYHARSGIRQVHDLHLSVLTEISFYDYKSLLDVGCGTGDLLARIPMRKGLDLAGIDFSAKVLEIAQEKIGHKANLRHGDSQNLPWEDNSFDMVLCSDSFHYFPRPEIVLSEVRRVTKPGGRLIIADPWYSWPIRRIKNLLLPLDRSGKVKIYSEEDFNALLRDAGYAEFKWRGAALNACVVSAQCMK